MSIINIIVSEIYQKFIRNLLKTYQIYKDLKIFYILNIEYIEYLNVSFFALLLNFTQNAFLFNHFVILIVLLCTLFQLW